MSAVGSSVGTIPVLMQTIVFIVMLCKHPETERARLQSTAAGTTSRD